MTSSAFKLSMGCGEAATAKGPFNEAAQHKFKSPSTVTKLASTPLPSRQHRWLWHPSKHTKFGRGKQKKKWSKGKQEKVNNGVLLGQTTYDKLINPSILSEHLRSPVWFSSPRKKNILPN